MYCMDSQGKEYRPGQPEPMLHSHCDLCNLRFGSHEVRYRHDDGQYHYGCYVTVAKPTKTSAIRALAYDEPPKAA